MDEIDSLSSMLRLYTECHQHCSNQAHFLRSVVQLYKEHHETCQDVHEESRTALDRELESYRHVTEKSENANKIKFITVSQEGNKRQKISALRRRKPNSERSVETFTRTLPKCEEFREKLCGSKSTDVVLPVPEGFEHQEVERLDTGHENARRRARETASWIKQADEVASIARLYLFCFLTYCVVLEDDGMNREDLDDIMRLAFVDGGTSKYLKSLRTSAKMIHREIVVKLVVTEGWTFGQITQLFSFCGPLRAYEYTYFTPASCRTIVEKVKGLRIQDYPGYCIGSYISKWDSSFSVEKVHHILGYDAEPPNPTQISTPHVSATQVRSNTPLSNPGEGTQACFQNTAQAGMNQNSDGERQAVLEDIPVQLSDLLGQDFRQDITDWEKIWAQP